MTGKEVAQLRDEELKLELGKIRSELFDLRSKSVTAKVEDTSRFGKLRGDLARVLGEHNKRRKASAPVKGAKAAVVAEPVAAAKAPAKAAKAAPKAAAKAPKAAAKK
jgi:ribosomal protein L29